MRRYSIFILVLFFAFSAPNNIYSQQTGNQKYFLNSHWSTKPDSSVKRQLIDCISYGIEDKFYDFNTLSQYPWEFNKPKNTQFVDINIQLATLRPSGFYRSFFEDFCLPDNTSHPPGSNIYSIDMMVSEKLGLLAGYRFFNHSKNKFFQPVLCGGFVYDASLFHSAISSNPVQYQMGDLLMRFELWLNIPKGFI